MVIVLGKKPGQLLLHTDPKLPSWDKSRSTEALPSVIVRHSCYPGALCLGPCAASLLEASWTLLNTGSPTEAGEGLDVLNGTRVPRVASLDVPGQQLGALLGVWSANRGNQRQRGPSFVWGNVG